MKPCPRILIAGTQSGVGKTSLSLGLVSALKRRGLRVQAFKVGPDFLDPSYLAIASGRPCHNLDTWMMGREYVQQLFARATQDADIAVIEGVMGLFDGVSANDLTGSTAEVAALLDAPVLLVVNVHGMARSLAAMVKGYAEFAPRVKVAGVLANHCGSEKHVESLGDSLRAADLPRLVGAVRRGALPSLPSRHLGLVTADQQTLTAQLLDALTDGLEKHARMEEVIALASAGGADSSAGASAEADAAAGERGHRPRLQQETTAPAEVRPSRPGSLRIGIARDAAFHFYYADLLDALARAGCEPAYFSPIADPQLPERLNAIYFGGGYPEEHAEALAANRPMRESVRRFSDAGHPMYAECGGLMYLSQEIETRDGRRHPMAGILPVACRMLERRKMLGYAEATLRQDSLWGAAGAKLRGHEFHYSEIAFTEPSSDWKPAYDIRHPRSDQVRSEGFQRGQTVASYVHLHLASQPAAVRHFLKLCAS